MNWKKRICFVLALVGAIPFCAHAQRKKAKKDPEVYKYTLKLQGGRHKIGLPAWRVKEGPLHPTFIIGVEDAWRSKKFTQMFQALELGTYYNNSAGYGYFLSIGIGFKFHVPIGTYLEVKTGVGFMHTFRPRPLYSLNNNGEFEKVRDYGEIRPAGDFGASFGQTFMKKRWKKPFSVFVNYRCLGQMFFNDRAKLLPHTFGTVGVKMHFKE